MPEILLKLARYITLVLVFVLPLFFLPFTTDFFEFNKMMLFAAGALVLLVVWALRGFLLGRVTIISSPLDLPVLLFAVSFVISTILQTSNKNDALLFPGSTTIVLSLTALYFVITHFMYEQSMFRKLCVYALLGAGVIVGLVSLAASVGLLSSLSSLPAFMKAKTFSVTGSHIATITFLAALLPIAVNEILRAIRSKATRTQLTSALFGVVGVIYILSILILVQQLIARKPPLRLLSLPVSWSIGVEMLKHSPFGIGPGNYLIAFNQFRPASYNQTNDWDDRYLQASNWYLHIFTTVGIVGFTAFLFIVLRVIQLSGFVRRLPVIGESTAQVMPEGSRSVSASELVVFYSLYAIFAILLLVPASLLVLVVLYVLLGVLGSALGRVLKIQQGGSYGITFAGSGRILPGVVLAVISIVTALAGVFGVKAYIAEIYYRQALEAASRNDSKQVYELLQKAIRQNQGIDRYHVAYSQANLMIANALTRKLEVTDKDKETISKLVQQSIRDGQRAVALNAKSSINWENLGNIYRALIPIAKSADQFAIASYSQAITYEPTNPNLRLSLGNVYYSLKQYDEAAKIYELAVLSKPNMANAYYSLALALREKGNTQQAIKAIEKVLTLVEPNSQDYETAKTELENLKSKLPKTTSRSGETLKAPAPNPKPVLNPKLEFPKETQPPASPVPQSSPQPEQ